ncbi:MULTISPECIES: 50S ribosomal protein L11 methyltransferase [Paracoccus]|jgi:ribosomal protein L11 methyltransferase|uniref:Ribosomal protein L11 methyltransferase n=1 Tax=Paracoccus litorisediminis TaxID=2006130 RepID=A0A844HL44_9RHOB|nr:MULTISPECIES: 50S ribosomal protein L11 methyltransferase [Paracoccus]MBD9526515.1 50S ribosomal protein L11 methyltransferase [Paracoccus sp. PAR01]MTH58915.1 50S ribosomal protein L11 methyltransferase [Paracoccus litorisediminis]
MPTWTALTQTAGREAAEALAEMGEDLTPEPVGSGVFEIEDGSDRWEVGLYFTESPDEVSLALMAAAFGADPFIISELPEVDWVAHVKRELSPVEAGRFFVHGSHDAEKIPEGSESLLIEAAMAFGTGHHSTTKGCLLALDRMIEAGANPQRIVDVGCGTAVLAMAAARVFPVIVLAGDIDPVAVDVAKANVMANGLDGRVECVEAMGFDHPLIEGAAPFDLVFANILKQPLIDLVPDMAKMIAPGGKAILSGILTTQADEVVAAYAKGGLALDRRDDYGEWSTLVVSR